MMRLLRATVQTLKSKGFKVIQTVNRNGDPIVYVKSQGWRFEVVGSHGSYELEPRCNTDVRAQILEVLNEPT